MDFLDKIKIAERSEDVLSFGHTLFTDNRDLTDLIVSSYKHLNNTFLCGYKLSVTTNKELWFCSLQSHLYKIRKGNKNITIDDIEENNRETLFNASLDILDKTTYQTLKLKYILDPKLIEKKSRYMAIINTIKRFNEEVSEYDTQIMSVVDILNKKILDIPEEERVINYSLQSANEDLFVPEKMVFLPIYDDKRHVYIVDNSKYYGIFSNSEKGRITSTGKYAMQYIAENKTVATTYIGELDEKFYITGFGEDRKQNIFTTFFYTEGYKVNEIKKHNINEFVDLSLYDTYYQMIWYNTWDDCIKNYTEQIKKKINPKPKNKKDKTISLTKIRRSVCIKGVYKYIECKNESMNRVLTPRDRLPKFTYALELEKKLLYILNAEKGPSPKMSTPDIIKRRIVINPFDIIKNVFKYSKEDPIMESNQTEPNPFDTMWMLSYRKISTHVTNKGNKDKSPYSKRIQESQKYILYYDLHSIGEFSSKGNQVGFKGMLCPGIDQNRVTVKRKGLIIDD